MTNDAAAEKTRSAEHSDDTDAHDLLAAMVVLGIWIVSFMRYDLGYIDLEQRTLQPLDNPFGPRLSPMS
jgi:hypothetical protein